MRPFSSLQNTASTQFMLRPLPLAASNIRSSSPVMMVVRRDFASESHSSVPNIRQSKNQYDTMDIDFMRHRVRATKLYHYTSIGLAVAIPAGLFLSPGIWMLPVSWLVVPVSFHPILLNSPAFPVVRLSAYVV